jgi:hypothetical protein
MPKYLPWEAWEEIRSQTAVVSLRAFSRSVRANLMHRRDLRALLEPDHTPAVNHKQPWIPSGHDG